MQFVQPQKARVRNFFHPVSRNPWEAIISGPVYGEKVKQAKILLKLDLDKSLVVPKGEMELSAMHSAVQCGSKDANRILAIELKILEQTSKSSLTMLIIHKFNVLSTVPATLYHGYSRWRGS